MFERLYDTAEQANIQFVGYATERTRYDFGIVYTNAFFGKPLVVCMQTNRSSLLDYHDLDNLTHLQKSFRLTPVEAAEVSSFLRQLIPPLPAKDQY
ncbi:DUF3055 domain-containing protein [Paenibacillus flagellatus]|uniref:DUF3055 domain-containing protein n=1 Tax=Paenibacillus flagellatus TaxID=2211139 RepID=A0A2V5KSA0_9BACL|nr:DUF3055 domain-containing protein [Paenibacillus flagellatus]PYI54467.1 hypothetical protein DLM86_13445 [Paenibacillus flagellatus]